MSLMLALLAISAAAGAPEPQRWDNPYAAPSSEFERRLQDAQLGRPGSDLALDRWLAAHPDLPPQARLRGFEQLCGDYGVLTWYHVRVAACAEQDRLKAHLKDGDEGDDDGGMAAALAKQPPVRAIGSARVPLVWNNFGSQNADVAVNGVTSSWFMDTGAEITVVTESLAKRMGIRHVANRIRVGTTTSDVFGAIGMIDALRMGTASVENVPVLILPDAQLKLGNVHQIDGILGLQVIVAFGRIAWVDAGRALALGEAAPKARATAPHIYWDEEGLGVPVRTPRGVRGAFLDTGANASEWRVAGVPLLDPAVLAGAKEVTRHVGGAGGVVELKQRELNSLAFDLGAVPVRLDGVPVAEADHPSAAKLGMDVVSQFGTFILDFEQMRIDGRLKTVAERKASPRRELTQGDIKLDAEKAAPDSK